MADRKGLEAIDDLPAIIKTFAEQVVRRDWQGTPYHIAKHHFEWLQHWQQSPLLLILAARGHGKTENVVVLPILWILASLQHQLVYIVSSSQEQAHLILDRVKTVLEREMPQLVDRERWAKQMIRTTTNNTVIAKGATTRIIGPHPNFIFVDDIIEDMQTIADSNLTRWFFASLFPMLAKDGRMLVVGTYKHFGDTYHSIEERGIFDKQLYPAINPSGKLLWPEYWTQAMIDERRTALGEVLFAREYMLKPVDEASSLLPMHLITECYNAEMPIAQSYDGPLEVYVGVDPAASASIGADYTVFAIMAYDSSTDHRTVLNVIRQRGMTLQAHIDMLQDIEESYRPVHVKIEKNAFQRWLEQEATGALRNMPISGHNTGKEKSDMREGVPSLRLMFERRLITIPRGPTESETKAGRQPFEYEAVKITQPLVDELNSLTWESGKIVSVAKHDDTVMALWLCNMAIKEGKLQRGLAITTVDTQGGGSRSAGATRASRVMRRPGGFR
jgi:hypothetical protein